jgi:hypothetical protein
MSTDRTNPQRPAAIAVPWSKRTARVTVDVDVWAANDEDVVAVAAVDVGRLLPARLNARVVFSEAAPQDA